LVLIGSSSVILAELVTFAGTTGIALIVAGGYTLNIRHIGSGFFEPIRVIAREKLPSTILRLCFAGRYIFLSFPFSIHPLPSGRSGDSVSRGARCVSWCPPGHATPSWWFPTCLR
jgi:hypothetical protein